MSDFVMGATVRLNNDFSGKMSSMVADTEKFKASAASADRALENLDKSLKGVNGNGLSKIGTSATQAATAAKGVVAPIDNIVQSTNRAQNAIQSFNRGWQTVKALPSTLSNIGNALKNNVADGFTSAKLQASILAATVKTLGKQKLTGMVDGIKEFTDTITEGKSGIKGFATGLKNIGKISIASTVNAVKSLTDKAKEFAKVKISNIANSIKGLKSSFTDGKTGAAGLHTALKKVASVSLSALHSGISKIGSLAKSAGSAVASGLGSAIKATAKGASVAIGAGVTAVGALVTGSVKAFADFQQLTGGVETLFGAGGQSLEDYAAGIGKSVDAASSEYNKLMASQQAVFDNANKAYETAGLSANAYMETVTSFSASLLQSLGGDTQKAASVADQAIIDMADNANKMGTSMDMIQNAYQGFAKQNYTMLDNLKLGYGGTKEEMQRLLTDAGKLANTKFDISSYADIIEAIHVIQNDMGITGTTANEAATTISGSAASMKAAWGNMLVSLTTGGDNFNKSIDALVQTSTTFARNVLPAVTGALSGVGKLIEGLAPMVAQELPGLVATVLPSLVNAAQSLVSGLITGISSNIPQMAQVATQVFTAFANFILQSVPQILLVGLDLIVGLAQGLTQGLPQIIQQGVQSIVNFCNGITSRMPTIITTAIQLIQTLVQGIAQNLPQIIQAGVTMIGSLLQGIVSMLPSILQSALQLIMSLVQGLIQNLPLILQTGVQLIQSLIQGIVTMLPMIIQSAIQLIISLVQGLIQNLPMIIQSAVQIVVALAGGLIQAIPQLVAAIPQLIAAIVDTIMSTNWLQVGWDIVKGIGKGLLDGIKGIFGGGGEEGGAAVATGAASGMTSNLGTVTAATTQVSTTMTQGLQPDTAAVNAAGANTMTALASGITANAGVVNTSVAGIAPGITTTLNSSLATVDTSATASTIGTNITTGVTTGIQTGTAEVVSAATDMSTQAQTAIDTGMSNISTSFNSLDISGITTKCTEITQAFTEGMANANTAVSEGITAITSTLNAVNLYSCGVNIMQGLNNGLASMRGTIIATAQSIANSVKATINSALDIHSPSRVLEESGEFSGEGFANGLLNLVNKVKENAKTLANTAIEPFSVQRAATDITPSGPVTGGGGKVLSGLKVIIENLNLNDVANKDPKQLVAEILKELYAQLGGDDELLGSVDMGVLL